jgi:hypothetical protein
MGRTSLVVSGLVNLYFLLKGKYFIETTLLSELTEIQKIWKTTFKTLVFIFQELVSFFMSKEDIEQLLTRNFIPFKR